MLYSKLSRLGLLSVTIGVLLACSDGFTRDAIARQLPHPAPISWTSDAWSVLDDNIQGARIGLRRSVPLHSLLPQTAPGSSAHVLILEGGIQSDDGDTMGRFRVAGMELDMQRGIKSVLFTLVDYDRAGTMDLNATWLRVGFGPGYTAKGHSGTVRTAIHVFSGLATRKLGRSLYPALPDNDQSETLLEGGLAGRSTVVFASRLRVDVRAEYAVHSQSDHLRTFMAQPELSWQPAASANVSVYAQFYGAERSSVTHHDMLFGVRLQIMR